MSKFFSDTRLAAGIDPGADSVVTDLDAAIESLREAGQISGPNGHSNGNEVARLLQPLDETGHLSSEVAASRLASCATIRLPRSEQKSFLAARPSSATHAALEAYRTLRTRLDKQQTEKGMRSLVISSATQGEGKTLTAFNLALCYAKMQNFPLLVVDADLRSRGLSRLLGDPESPGLSKILEGGCDYRSAILGTDCAGLYALPAGSSVTSPPELFSGPNWKEFMAWATETFRLVIVDCPPILEVADFELVMASCDSVIAVVRSRKTSSLDLCRALAQIDARKMAGVVFNAAEEPRRGYYPA